MLKTPEEARGGDLITRLEQTAEGSRELDARICAVEENRTITYDDQGRMLGRYNEPPHDCCILFWEGGPDYTYVPRYTTSLDAALALVPEGWRVQQLTRWIYGDLECWEWELAKGTEVVFTVGDIRKPKPPTMALALCIAALRARE